MTLVKTWNILSYGLSDIGLSRHKNEDAWARDLSCHLYALADGIGGRQAGEVASQYAVNRLCQIIGKDSSLKLLQNHDQTCDLLLDSIQQTNADIFDMAQQNEFLHGMGTTLCCLLIHEELAYTAHIGDSRIYLLRRGKLFQLTQDHKPSSYAAPCHYITRALGVRQQAQPCVQWYQVQEDDLFLLCSDGLSNALSHSRIEQILLESDCLKECSHILIDQAKQASGSDNITALLVHLHP